MPAVKGKENLTKVWGDENFITEEGTFVLKAKDSSQLDKGKYLVLWKKNLKYFINHSRVSLKYVELPF